MSTDQGYRCCTIQCGMPACGLENPLCIGISGGIPQPGPLYAKIKHTVYILINTNNNNSNK